jgi:hypothetical protein
VKDLSERMQALERAIGDRGELLETARSVYDVRDVRLDPLSPDLHAFAQIPAGGAARVAVRAVELLGTLERADAAWREFYAGRRRAVEVRRETLASTVEAATVTSSPAQALEEARRALKAGDMTRLSALAAALAAVEAPAASAPAHPLEASRPAVSEPVREVPPAAYGSETLDRARRLGLAARHLDPRPELAALRRYAWTPLSDQVGHSAAPVPMPPGLPEGLGDGLAIFLIHPLVNSGGARYLPSLLAEDVLVEDFPDPGEGQATPPSVLVSELGLPGRRGLPRIAIEQALLLNGARILEHELGLDPRVFRLVCIPPDVYLRVGETGGWGRQPFWTHLDGYLVQPNGRLRALAGGDVRYGGLYELLAVGRDYDSDRLLVRFAVVRRERMAAW